MLSGEKLYSNSINIKMLLYIYFICFFLFCPLIVYIVNYTRLKNRYDKLSLEFNSIQNNPRPGVFPDWNKRILNQNGSGTVTLLPQDIFQTIHALSSNISKVIMPSDTAILNYSETLNSPSYIVTTGSTFFFGIIRGGAAIPFRNSTDTEDIVPSSLTNGVMNLIKFVLDFETRTINYSAINTSSTIIR